MLLEMFLLSIGRMPVAWAGEHTFRLIISKFIRPSSKTGFCLYKLYWERILVFSAHVRNLGLKVVNNFGMKVLFL